MQLRFDEVEAGFFPLSGLSPTVPGLPTLGARGAARERDRGKPNGQGIHEIHGMNTPM
jgi:hypothetical protein